MVTALNAEFLRDLSYVAEDEGLMKKQMRAREKEIMGDRDI